MAGTPTPEHALDHVVVVLFENRSLTMCWAASMDPETTRPSRGYRERPQESHPRVGRARCRPQGGSLRVATEWTRPIPTRVRSTSTPTPNCSTPSTTTIGSRSARASAHRGTHRRRARHPP